MQVSQLRNIFDIPYKNTNTTRPPKIGICNLVARRERRLERDAQWYDMESVMGMVQVTYSAATVEYPCWMMLNASTPQKAVVFQEQTIKKACCWHVCFPPIFV